MELLPLRLYAKRGNWQKFNSRKRSKRFLDASQKIFRRDKNTCRFCGFRLDKYMEIVNFDNDYTNNNSKNLVTSCSMCYQSLFLDGIGTNEQTGGFVIYLPEVSQADLNHFCRILFTSMTKDAPYKGKLYSSYLSLKDRGDATENIFGSGSNVASSFGQTIIDSNFTNEELQHPIIDNLRLLPERKFFQQEIEYWKETIFAELPI